MSPRPAVGRGLFYTRDSEGHSDLAPPQYVTWARGEAARLGVAFDGTPEAMAAMIARGVAAEGDLFVDYGVSGNYLSRPGFDALRRRALGDTSVSHLFVPRRDRIARPDNPVDALTIECELRSAGLTLVFMERIIAPLPRGRRIELADLLTGLIDYDASGRFRRDLAEKLIHAKIRLAEQGYSIGGEPLYGFRRWLCAADGALRRELEPGEVVKMAGHHVLWLPTAEGELAVVRRILALIETTPAARIARMLNDEGVPSPRAGRSRRRGGVVRPVSGLWTQNTVKNLATHPLLIAVCESGRRAMGDQLRLTPSGPRPLADGDYGPGGRPRTVANSPEGTIRVAAPFEPLIPPERHEAIRGILEERGRHLKGKARTRRDAVNPLGGRIFDLNCGWLMYRHARRGRYGYQCGLYQNSQARACTHNVVPGDAAARFVLACLRQRVLSPTALAKLTARLRELAATEGSEDPGRRRREALEAELSAVERKLATVGRNLALAESPAERQATAVVFGELQESKARLSQQLTAVPAAEGMADPEREVAAALATLDRLHELSIASESDGESVAELLRRVDARLYLRFRAVSCGSRMTNVPSGGVLTFGSTPPPGPLYQGPTDRAIIRRMLAASESVSASPGRSAPGSPQTGPEVPWSANVQRGTSRCSGPGPPAGFSLMRCFISAGRSAELLR